MAISSRPRNGSDGPFATRKDKIWMVLAALLLLLIGAAITFLSSLWLHDNNEQYNLDSANNVDQPGIQVMNAILANMWPSLGKSILENMRAKPTSIDPYILTLNRGELQYPPRIDHIEPLFTDITTDPVQFKCRLEYTGVPDLEFILTGADKHHSHNNNKIRIASLWKRAARRLVPDVILQVKSINLFATLHVLLDMHTSTVEFYFFARPKVDWDLEIIVSNIPLFGEDKLDTILTSVLANFDDENPIRVKF